MNNRREDFIAYVNTVLNATYFRDDIRSDTKATLINLLDTHAQEMLAEQREACAIRTINALRKNNGAVFLPSVVKEACLNARVEKK